MVEVGWAPDSLKGDAVSYPLEPPVRKYLVQGVGQHCPTEIQCEPHVIS